MHSFTSTQFIYGIVSGILPSLLWLWFWMKENNLHPEPKKTLFGCFLFGMMGVFLAAPLQWFVGNFVHDTFHQYVLWAAIEEVIKFGVVGIIAFRSGKFDEPIDSMIFMITAALGFAALENVFFMLGIINKGDVIASVLDGNARFIGAVLLHSVASALAGFTIALAFYRGVFIRIIAGIIGLALATALHAYFNLSIITAITKIDKLKALGIVWVGVVFLIILFEEIKGFEIKGDKMRSKV